MNGEMNVAARLAAINAWLAEKQSVTLTLNLVRKHFTRFFRPVPGQGQLYGDVISAISASFAAFGDHVVRWLATTSH